MTAFLLKITCEVIFYMLAYSPENKVEAFKRGESTLTFGVISIEANLLIVKAKRLSESYLSITKLTVSMRLGQNISTPC